MKDKLYEIKRTKGGGHIHIPGTGPRVIIQRAGTFVSIQKSCERDLGEGANVLFYEAGIDSGKVASSILLPEPVDIEFSFRDVIGGYYSSNGVGWFKLEDVTLNISEGSGEIKISQSFIPSEYGQSNVPVCHFLCGFFVGLLERLYGMQLICEETECESMGSSFCTFSIYKA